MSAISYRRAAVILAERDPVLARLVAEAGPVRFPKVTGSNFSALVQAITYQQLAGAAARAIHGRLVDLLGGEVTPEAILARSPDELLSAGLSHAKAASVHDLAAKVLDGSVIIDGPALARSTDDEIVTRLAEVRGIGTWTAQIFLLVKLRRLDVLPTGDLGVRKGYGLAWGIPTPTPTQLEAFGEPFRPYRSVLSWYCWRAAELIGGARPSAVTASPVVPR